MAVGDPKPAWPMPSVKPRFATWSIGGGRPFGCSGESCARWHAGIDLTRAPNRAVVVAPEDGIVTAVDRGWSGDAKAVFLRTDSGLFLVLGGFIRGSSAEFGITPNKQVRKGERLGRVLGSYHMIHLETYIGDRQRTRNSIWRRGKPPPTGLLNPTNYIQRMVGDRISLVRTVQRHEALARLGHYSGERDAPWGSASEAATRAAQTALGIEVDGKWGPATERAIVTAIAENRKPGDDCYPDTCASPAPVGRRPAEFPGGARLWWGIAGATAAVGVGIGVWMTRKREP